MPQKSKPSSLTQYYNYLTKIANGAIPKYPAETLASNFAFEFGVTFELALYDIGLEIDKDPRDRPWYIGDKPMPQAKPGEPKALAVASWASNMFLNAAMGSLRSLEIQSKEA